MTIEPSYEEHPLYEKEFLGNIHSAFFVSAKDPAVENGKINKSKLTGPIIISKQMESRRKNQFKYSEIIKDKKQVRQMDALLHGEIENGFSAVDSAKVTIDNLYEMGY